MLYAGGGLIMLGAMARIVWRWTLPGITTPERTWGSLLRLAGPLRLVPAGPHTPGEFALVLASAAPAAAPHVGRLAADYAGARYGGLWPSADESVANLRAWEAAKRALLRHALQRLAYGLRHPFAVARAVRPRGGPAVGRAARRWGITPSRVAVAVALVGGIVVAALAWGWAVEEFRGAGSGSDADAADALAPADAPDETGDTPATLGDEPAAAPPVVDAEPTVVPADTAPDDAAPPDAAADSSAPPATWEVRPGDTLTAISAETGASIEEIVRLNDLPDPDTIHVGQVLILPAP